MEVMGLDFFILFVIIIYLAFPFIVLVTFCLVTGKTCGKREKRE